MADMLYQSGYTVYNSQRYGNSIVNILQNDAKTPESIISGADTITVSNLSSSDDEYDVDGAISDASAQKSLSNQFSTLMNDFNDSFQSVLGSGLNAISSVIGKSNGSAFGIILSEVAGAIASTAVYVDGVSETSFGLDQEASWQKWIASEGSRFKYEAANPFGANSNGSLAPAYGGMILGTPPTYTSETDPGNRTVLNTFVKDMRFISLTPGMPKFNGGAIDQLMNFNGTYKSQTPDIDSMLQYLNKNGIDSQFINADRRYYTFKTAFDQYYAYLETMLNTMWIKLGLANTGDGSKEFNLMSFFNEKKDRSRLKTAYKSAIGFYLNGIPGVSQSVSNSEYSPGLENAVNDKSSEFQQINYVTGMGSGSGVLGTVKGVARAAANVSTHIGTVKSNIIDPIMSVVNEASGFAKIAAAVKGVTDFVSKTDITSLVQQFTATNGMKVKYPNLWQDSNYSKNINFDIEFVSPYGDPLSIFQYVYVPFFALLAFTLPRQCDQNGYVSPFFVRADIPGLITSDLALISDMTFTKGGSGSNLWTKDGLPRAIHCSVTLTDLYPYLAMTKRISFLSANPSYTVFLDNMAGMATTYSGTTEDDNLDQIFREMLNRVNGQTVNGATNAHKINAYTGDVFKKARNIYNDANSSLKSPSSGLDKRQMPWFTKN